MAVEHARAIVRVEYLLATEPFQSSEETRYYLKGLSIEPHPRAGAIIVATDGHTMSVIHDGEAIVSGERTIWSMPWKATLAAPMKAFLKATKGTSGHVYADLSRTQTGPSRIRLVYADKAADVFNGQGIEFFTKSSTAIEGHFWVEGTFPDYRRVIPTENRAATFKPAWYQARYMAKLAAFGQAIYEATDERGAYTAMCMFTSSDDGPGVALFPSPNCFVIIMPLRERAVSDEDGGLPAWFFDQGEEKPKVKEKPELRVAA